MFKIDFRNSIICDDMKDINRNLSEKEKLFGKKIFISGASGMIASYLVGYIAWLNEKYNADIKIYAGIRNEEKAVARYGDLLKRDYFKLVSQDVNNFDSNFECVDYIIHAASLASPQYYGKMPVETMLPNIVGTNRLLQKAMKDKVLSFLFISSGSVYGTVDDVASVRECDIGKLDFLAKGNVYGESKRCGEALCRAYYNEYNVPVKIARVHHTYGPTADIENDSRVFSEFTNNIVNNRDIVLKSSGSDKRAFCYISDAVTGLMKILLSENNGEIYNTGNPDEYLSIADLAQMMVDLFPERGLKVVKESRQDAGYKASPEKRTIPVNVEKLELLGWIHKVSAKEGFFRMISAIEQSYKINSK